MASFTLSAFLCVAVLSSITLEAIRVATRDVPSAPCPEGWVHNNKRCYLYFPEKRSWIDAEMHCVSFEGNLASERTADEHSFLKKLHKPDGDKLAFWIGLSDVHQKGTWIWSDGTKMDFKKWNSGEPKSSGGKEDCVLSNSDAIPFPGPCPIKWKNHNGNCYQYVSKARSWIDAELHCLSLGANLASEHTQEDHFSLLVLQIYSGGKGPFWIGLSDVHKEGAWLWSDGSRVDFTGWNFGEPNSSGGNEDCVHSNFGDGDWNDSLCPGKYPFICCLRPY